MDGFKKDVELGSGAYTVHARNIVALQDKVRIVEPGFNIFWQHINNEGTASDFAIIGVASSSNILYIFSTNNINSRIDRVKNDVNTTLVNSKYLNFRIESPIKGEVSFNDKGQDYVVWTDNYNPPRLIIGDSIPFNVDSNKELYTPDIPKIDLLQITPKVTPLQFNSTKVLKGGDLDEGMYRIGIQYQMYDGSWTHVSNFSMPIPCYNQMNSDTEFEGLESMVTRDLGGLSIEVFVYGLQTIYNKGRIILSRLYKDKLTYAIGPTFDVNAISLYIPTYSVEYVGDYKELQALDTVAGRISPQYISTAKTLNLHNGELYLGNIGINKHGNLQKYFNKCVVTWNTVSSDIHPYNNLPTYDNAVQEVIKDRSFLPGEVYALGIRVHFKDGTVSPVYHIPGREALPGETDLVVSSGYSPIDYYIGSRNGYKKFHLKETGAGDGRLAYWENESDYYPDNEDFDYYDNSHVEIPEKSLRGQKVRHHKIPFLRTIYGNDYSGDGSGYMEIKPITLLVSNIGVPLSIQNEIAYYEVVVGTKRKVADNIVLGSGVMERFDGDSITTHAAFYDKWLHTLKPSITNVYFEGEYVVGTPGIVDSYAKWAEFVEWGTENTKLILEDVQYLSEANSLTTPNNELKPSRIVFKLVYEDDSSYLKAKSTTFLTDDVLQAPGIMIGHIKQYTKNVHYLQSIEYVQREAFIRPYSDFSSVYIKGDRYFTIQNFTWTEFTEKNTAELTEGTMYKILTLAEDIDLTKASGKFHPRYEGIDNDVAKGSYLQGSIFIFKGTVGDGGDSVYLYRGAGHCNLYPGFSLTSPSFGDFVDEFNLFPSYQGGYGFKEITGFNGLEGYPGYDYLKEYERFPRRVYRSLNVTGQKTLGNLRTVRPLDYTDCVDNSDFISGIETLQETLIIIGNNSTEIRIPRTDINTKGVDVFLGHGDLFQSQSKAKELAFGTYQSMSITKFTLSQNGILTHALVFVDSLKGAVILMTKGSFVNLSEYNVKYFKKKMELVGEEDSPIAGKGIITGYDPEFNRLLMTIIDREDAYSLSNETATTYSSLVFTFEDNLAESLVFNISITTSKGGVKPLILTLGTDFEAGVYGTQTAYNFKEALEAALISEGVEDNYIVEIENNSVKLTSTTDLEELKYPGLPIAAGEAESETSYSPTIKDSSANPVLENTKTITQDNVTFVMKFIPNSLPDKCELLVKRNGEPTFEKVATTHKEARDPSGASTNEGYEGNFHDDTLSYTDGVLDDIDTDWFIAGIGIVSRNADFEAETGYIYPGGSLDTQGNCQLLWIPNLMSGDVVKIRITRADLEIQKFILEGSSTPVSTNGGSDGSVTVWDESLVSEEMLDNFDHEIYILSSIKGLTYNYTEQGVKMVTKISYSDIGEEGITLSFSFYDQLKQWISEHSYKPFLYVNYREKLYNAREATLYQHLDKDPYGVFYDEVYPSFLDYCLPLTDLRGVRLDGIEWIWIARSYVNNAILSPPTYVLAYNSYQCTGKCQIPQELNSHNYSMGVAEGIDFSKFRENKWSFNRLVNELVDAGMSPVDEDGNVNIELFTDSGWERTGTPTKSEMAKYGGHKPYHEKDIFTDRFVVFRIYVENDGYKYIIANIKPIVHENK